MTEDDADRYLEGAFQKAKAGALEFIERHNALLPTETCPTCGVSGHVPGLPCPECSHCYKVSWAILRDGEWGYEAVALNDRNHVFARFDVADG